MMKWIKAISIRKVEIKILNLIKDYLKYKASKKVLNKYKKEREVFLKRKMKGYK